MYSLNIPQDDSVDALIEGYLKSHPDDSVEDALGAIFAAGVSSLFIRHLEHALIARNAEKQPC